MQDPWRSLENCSKIVSKQVSNIKYGCESVRSTLKRIIRAITRRQCIFIENTTRGFVLDSWIVKSVAKK